MELTEGIRALLQKKAKGGVSLRIAWENAIQQCASCGMPPRIIMGILGAFESPSSMAILSRLIASDPIFLENRDFEKTWEQFSVRCENSNYDEYQWFKGIERVIETVRVNSTKTTFCTVLGYLTCVEEFAYGSNSTNTLDQVVAEMIEEYGFEG